MLLSLLHYLQNRIWIWYTLMHTFFLKNTDSLPDFDTDLTRLLWWPTKILYSNSFRKSTLSTKTCTLEVGKLVSHKWWLLKNEWTRWWLLRMNEHGTLDLQTWKWKDELRNKHDEKRKMHAYTLISWVENLILSEKHQHVLMCHAKANRRQTFHSLLCTECESTSQEW